MNDAQIRISPYINTKPLVIGNESYQSFYDFALTEKDLERARTELGESDERKEACLRELKERLLSDKNFKYRVDDSYLLRFLRTRKYDVDKTYQNLKHFYDMRNKFKDWFELSEETKSIQELNFANFLPYADEKGCILATINPGSWNPSELSFEEFALSVTNMADIGLSNPKTQINGTVVIYDFDGLSLKHITEMLQKGRMWAVVQFIANSFPMRIKKMIFINTNRYLRYLYHFMKPFTRKKILDRIFLLGSDMKDLHELVNPALLPKRLNGSLEEGECDMTQFILDNLPYLRYERSFISSK